MQASPISDALEASSYKESVLVRQKLARKSQGKRRDSLIRVEDGVSKEDETLVVGVVRADFLRVEVDL